MDELPIVARLDALSNPPYDAGVFGGPMSRAAALIRAQHEALEKVEWQYRAGHSSMTNGEIDNVHAAVRAALAKARGA